MNSVEIARARLSCVVFIFYDAMRLRGADDGIGAAARERVLW